MAHSTPHHDDHGTDIRDEDLLTFGQIARRLRKTCGDGGPAPETIWRWARRGCRSESGRLIRLAYVRFGGKNRTSIEAVWRFFDLLRDENSPAAAEEAATVKLPKKTSGPSTAAKAEWAMRELRRRGTI